MWGLTRSFSSEQVPRAIARYGYGESVVVAGGFLWMVSDGALAVHALNTSQASLHPSLQCVPCAVEVCLLIPCPGLPSKASSCAMLFVSHSMNIRSITLPPVPSGWPGGTMFLPRCLSAADDGSAVYVRQLYDRCDYPTCFWLRDLHLSKAHLHVDKCLCK